MSPDENELKIAVQQQEHWSRRLSVTVPAERVRRTRQSVASQIAGRARLPGFRPGKVPASVLQQRFGPAIEQETVDRIVQEAYRDALKVENLQPITQGKIDKIQYEEGTDLTFEVEFEVQPEVQIGRNRGFLIQRTEARVGEDEVGNVLERLRDERAGWHPLEPDVKPDYGDEVTVDITVLEAAGESLENPERREYRFALGEGQAIPAVEEAIMTLTIVRGDDFTVHFPEDFPDEARRGQEQRLHIELVSARRKELPDLDDEFARSVGDFETLEDLRERVLTDLKVDAERRSEADVRRQLIDQILDANSFVVPPSMIERYLDQMTGHPEDDAHGKKRQLSLEEEERISQLRDALRGEAEWSLKRMLVVEHLADREGLRATQDDIDARVAELARRHERSESEVWLTLEKSGQLEMLEREIMDDRVFEYLKSQNTIQDQ